MTGASAYPEKRDLDSSKFDISLLRLKLNNQIFYDPASNTTLRVLRNYTLQDGEGICTVYRQTQITDSYVLIQGPWVNACHFTNDAKEDGEYDLSYSYSYDWRIDSGAIDWEEISPIVGEPWRRLVKKEGLFICHIPAQSSGRVLYLERILEGNGRFREVKKCGERVEYSGWTDYFTFKIPGRTDFDYGTEDLECLVGTKSHCDLQWPSE